MSVKQFPITKTHKLDLLFLAAFSLHALILPASSAATTQFPLTEHLHLQLTTLASVVIYITLVSLSVR